MAVVCLPFIINGQNPARVTMHGILHDTTGMGISSATVMLLNPADSTLVSFTSSDKTGHFRFNSVKNEPWLLKVSHVAFMPYQKSTERYARADADLGIIRMEPFSQILMQVVVKDARAPIKIHGDTVEYDVSTFKVPPGSTVEDLIKRLPGIEVDESGNISSQGKNVKRVYVDGKSFFGDDPKTVTQNLGSEAIRKVQVYDEKSEQAKITGQPERASEKAMNLELKEDFKKGSFGKATLAGGTEERWAAKANYNRFDEKQQLSFIGYANNINQSGVNWEDYREFKGQAGFGDFSEYTFGFSGGNRRMFRSDFSSDVPISRDSDKGFSRSFGAGANYNYDNKKTTFNASYFYSGSTLWLDQFSQKRTFLPDSIIFSADTLNMTDFRGNHSLSSRISHEFDSTSVISAKMSMSLTPSESSSGREQWFAFNDTYFNHLTTGDESRNLSGRVNAQAMYRKSFKKTGRSFAASTVYSYSGTNGEENLNSINKFFSASSFTEQVDQLNDNTNASRSLSANLLYSDAFSKRFYWNTFYNFNSTVQQRSNEVTDGLLSGNPRVDSLSYFFSNPNQYNRLGTVLMYSYKGTEASAGVAAENLQITGAYANREGEEWIGEPLTRSFNNLTPYVSVSQEFENGIFVETGYSYNIEAPSMSNLLPRPAISNPLFISLGNPDLKPQKSHDLSGSLHYWNQASFSSVGVNINYYRYDQNIVQRITTVFIDSIGLRTITRPENLKGGDNLNAFLWSSFPIVKTILTMSLNGSYSMGSSPAYVNDILNETSNQGYSAGVGFNLTPGNKLSLSLNGRISANLISYSIQKSHNQQIYNQSASATVRYQFMQKTFFESNFSYTSYQNESFGFDQDIPLWNASLRRIFGAKNRLEIRLAAFDVLNKRIGITQNGNQNYAIQTVSNTLGRYYMLSASYNIKGYDLKGQQGRRRGFF